MYEKALREQWRFPSTIGGGGLTLEDLWQLPLTSARPNVANLNSVAKTISKELKDSTQEDFVTPKSGADEVLAAKLEIVKHVIQVKQAENEALRATASRNEKKARLLELIARKQDEQLEGKSLEDLQAMVAEL